MMDSITSFIQNNIPAHAVTGLVGIGAFGNALVTALRARGQRVMLCDPPRSAEDADELCDALHIQWGNGMGGCDFSALSTETFVPLDNLIRYADVILSVILRLSERRISLLIIPSVSRIAESK